MRRRRKRRRGERLGMGTYLCQGSHLPFVFDHYGFHQRGGLEQDLSGAFNGKCPVSTRQLPDSLCLFMMRLLVEVFESIDECHPDVFLVYSPRRLQEPLRPSSMHDIVCSATNADQSIHSSELLPMSHQHSLICIRKSPIAG